MKIIPLKKYEPTFTMGANTPTQEGEKVNVMFKSKPKPKPIPAPEKTGSIDYII